MLNRRTGCTPDCSQAMFLPHFSIYSEGGNIADPVTMSLFFQGHVDMFWRTNSLKDSLDPSHLVFGESTLLCLGPNLFIFAPMLWTAEIVSDRENKNQQVACTSFLLFLLQPVFPVFYLLLFLLTVTSLEPRPSFFDTAQGAKWGNDQCGESLWSSELPLYLSDVARYLVPPQLCRMPSDNDLTYWDGVAFVPWLDMVPWTWKVFQACSLHPACFGGFGIVMQWDFFSRLKC